MKVNTIIYNFKNKKKGKIHKIYRFVAGYAMSTGNDHFVEPGR